MAATRVFAVPVVLLSTLLTLGVAAAASAERPSRIVSMNLCTDQLLLMLADRDRIVSLSYLAANPRSSAMAREAQGLHLNHGLAEEILPLEPDLVIAGAFTTRPTVFLLRELGYRVIDQPVANDLDDVRANIRRIAAAIGEPDRGEALIAAFDARLAALPPARGRAPRTALYWANGFTSGKGTLAQAIVTAAGLHNLAADLGIAGSWQLPLESLLAANPEALITGRSREQPALANESLRHPALEQRFANRPQLRIADKYWICGTPWVATAIERLAAFRQSIQSGRTRPDSVDKEPGP